MYFINKSIIASKPAIRTGRTRPPTCIFIKITLFGTITGTTNVIQVTLSKINEFQYILDTPGRETATSNTMSRPSRYHA